MTLLEMLRDWKNQLTLGQTAIAALKKDQAALRVEFAALKTEVTGLLDAIATELTDSGPVDPGPTDPIPPDPVPVPVPAPTRFQLPAGYDTNQGVALTMLKASMSRHGYSAVFVQGKGKAIAQALNDDYIGLDVYANRRTDAVMWPGFGSIDCTIDSGKGGFYFRVDPPPQHVPYGEDR